MSSSTDLGCLTNIEALQRFVSLADRRVVDVGCGAMGFTRELANLGASVLAIDPDPIQAELNRKQPATPNVDFVEASGEAIPVEDGSIDGVLFVYSLHHVPAASYDQVFNEVWRVLKPDGFLYVIEPIGCPLNDVMKMFHDEEVVRAAAQDAIRRLAMPKFKSAEEATYHSIREFDGYEDFVRFFSEKTFNAGYTEEDVRRPEVKEAFHRLASPDFRFHAPKKVAFMQGKAEWPEF